MTRRYRVLVIAEAANPEWVSVPLVGWSVAAALRGVADVHIVTQQRNRAAFLRAGLIEGDDFTAIDTERVAGPAYRLASLLRGGAQKGWTVVTALGALVYPYFERQVWRRFGRAIRQGRYDVVHRITPLTPTSGGSLARRCARAGVPFVLGPLNGGLPWPAQFAAERRKEKEGLSRLRSAYKLLPRRSATLAAARAILAGSLYTASEIPARFAGKLIYMPENGIDPARFSAYERPDDGSDRLGLCFIGRLVPYKGADMAIRAAAGLLRSGRARLDIVGDGPMRAALEALAEQEGVRDHVRFHGWVEHGRVQDIASGNDIFLFPSIREFGGGAVLEAMALGLVPVIVDYGGPGELVSADRGIKVPLTDRAGIVRALAEALDELARDRSRLLQLGSQARAWTLRHLTWAAKAAAMRDIYAWTCGDLAEKPEPYRPA